jgi:hypothetical protein
MELGKTDLILLSCFLQPPWVFWYLPSLKLIGEPEAESPLVWPPQGSPRDTQQCGGDKGTQRMAFCSLCEILTI